MSEKPFINIDNLEYKQQQNGKKFEANIAPIGTLIGAEKLGYRMVVLPPGKAAWPFHSHLVNEEMFFIIEGSGMLRHGSEEYKVTTGDVICSPPKKDLAHQIVNDSNSELKYMAVSTNVDPDICIYPDSDKFGVYSGYYPNPDTDTQFFIMGREKDGLDYWDGE